ncbi:MAG: c-type cytochrome [Candidatus Longimicrobiales bacterium M2_2A_002]
MRHAPIIIGSLACALAALAAAPPHTVAPQDPAAGEAIFKGKGSCFTCHGPRATGTTLAPDLTDDAWVNFDARPSRDEVETLVREGVTKPVQHPAPMPPMGGARLSDEEIGDVAAYVLSLSAASEGGEG